MARRSGPLPAEEVGRTASEDELPGRRSMANCLLSEEAGTAQGASMGPRRSEVTSDERPAHRAGLSDSGTRCPTSGRHRRRERSWICKSQKTIDLSLTCWWYHPCSSDGRHNRKPRQTFRRGFRTPGACGPFRIGTGRSAEVDRPAFFVRFAAFCKYGSDHPASVIR